METLAQVSKTSRRRRWLWLLLILPLLPFLPMLPGTATFEGVGVARGQKIHRRVSSERFLLEGGKLYLLRQQTWHALVLITYVREIKWSSKEMEDLRRRFPELDSDLGPKRE